MSDIEINFSDDNLSIDMGSDVDHESIKVSKKTKKKKKPLSKKPAMFSQQFGGKPKVPPQLNDKSFEMFSNPSKRLQQNEEDFGDDDENEMDQGENASISGESNENEYGNNYENMNEYEEQPSPGYETIEDEKQDLIYKFYRLKNKGVHISKNFNMHSDISEMRTEYKKITRDAEVNASLKFSKRMLLAVVSGTEFLNKRYDPLGIELNGWSESVMENINDGDYDNVFERLHDKYTGKVNTPPELELMLSLAGSAIMFHMTSTMFKQLPNMNDISKQNPEMMQNLMKSMSNMMNNNNQSDEPKEPTIGTDGRREMRGPSMNMAGLFPGMGPPPPAPMSSNDFEVPESVMSDSSSEASEQDVRSVSYVTTGGTRRRGKKVNIDSANTIDI